MKISFSPIKIKIENKFYKRFSRNVNRELKNTYGLQSPKDVYNQANPVTLQNIDHMKKCVLDFFSGPVIPTLRNKLFLNRIKAAKSPQKLYDLINKKFYKQSVIADTAINVEEEVLFNKSKDYINKITPKSTKPEAIKIENEIRKNGIPNPNISDDTSTGQLIIWGLKKLKAGGINISIDSIIVNSMGIYKNKGVLGNNIPDFKHQTSMIILRPYQYMEKCYENIMMRKYHGQKTNAFKNTSKKFKERFTKETIKNPFQSTESKLHDFYHEIGHSFDKEIEYSKAELNELKDISRYAQNESEIVPEIFAMLMDERELTQKQLDIYVRHGGQIPHFKHV